MKLAVIFQMGYGLCRRGGFAFTFQSPFTFCATCEVALSNQSCNFRLSTHEHVRHASPDTRQSGQAYFVKCLKEQNDQGVKMFSLGGQEP